jgi:hypothetical protein
MVLKENNMNDLALVESFDVAPVELTPEQKARAKAAIDPKLSGSGGPETLRINYDEDSIHDRGLWVYGQKKDASGVITEEGELVDRIIVCTFRHRHTCYDQDSKQFFFTQMFENGGAAADRKEVEAAVAALGKELKYQCVVMGLAVVKGELKEFIANCPGVAYGAFKDLLTARAKDDMPLHYAWTLIGPSEKGKNGSVVFYTPSFSVGPAINPDHWDLLDKAVSTFNEYVVMTNNRTATNAAAAPVGATPAAYVAPTTVSETPPPADKDEPMPWETATPVEGTVTPVAEAGASGLDDYDIEAEMKSIMGG